MRWTWAAGAIHGLVGSAILFLSFHPLRDALDAHALELARAGSALEAVQGLALLSLARMPRTFIPAALIAAGTTAWTAMLYIIVFTGQHPLDLMVPAGGMVMLAGWLALLFVDPKAS